ncbi:GAF domain-containing protein [Eubacteriaceae bacterium ES3]|nr:GAF domain-containing protein [Eubacteriaceae bacterium ES3]
MSLKMSGLLDIEKYLLLELVYYHLPAFYQEQISRQTPLALDLYIDLIPQCKNAMVPQLIDSSKRMVSFSKKRQRHFQRVFATSDNLADLRVTGYINDNFGACGNTGSWDKTSLVALALEDSSGNGAVVFSGCENRQISGIVLDWGGCLLASVGIDTRHHRKAIDFYDHSMRDITGERNLFGHSKGGNLATYVFINRLTEKTNAYCVNAQPYCWPAMNEIQKEALKSERYEYIVHQNDPTRNTGYVSYISRIAPLNRYSGRGLIDIHNFGGVSFDSYGNLEGTRVIRETRNALQARIFNDYSMEKRWSHNECVARFRQQAIEIKSLPRLFSMALDELLLVVQAETAVIWLKDEDEGGEFIYPLIIKRKSGDDFYQLKLRKGEGLVTRAVFDGMPLLQRKPDQAEVRTSRQMTGISITSLIAVPLGIDEKEVFGALELTNKIRGVFSLEDFALVNEITLIMLELFRQSGESLAIFKDFSLLQLKKHGQRLFSVERFSYTEVYYKNQDEQQMFYEKIIGKRLAAGERLIFNRQSFTAEMRDPLKRLYDQEYFDFFANFDSRKVKVKTYLKQFLKNLDYYRMDLSELVRLFGMEDILKTSVRDLEDKKYVLMFYGLTRIKNPKILIVKQPMLIEPAVFNVLCEHLKKVSRKKMMTVVVLKLEKV